MLCFCFRSNKISPSSTGATEMPDILAIPEAAGITQDATAAAASRAAAGDEHNGSQNAPGSDPSDTNDAQNVGNQLAFGNSELVSDSKNLCGSDECVLAIVSEENAASANVDTSGNAACDQNEIDGNGACFQATNEGPSENVSNGVEEGIRSSEVPPQPQNSDEFSSAASDPIKHNIGPFYLYCCNDVKETDDVTKIASTASSSSLDRQRPLVIMIPWLTAKRGHVHKYCRLYMERGMDVLVIPVTPGQVMRPQKVKRTARELLKHLQDKDGCLAERPLLVHGFSVGGFVWGQVLVELEALLAQMTQGRDDGSIDNEGADVNDNINGDGDDVHDDDDNGSGDDDDDDVGGRRDDGGDGDKGDESEKVGNEGASLSTVDINDGSAVPADSASANANERKTYQNEESQVNTAGENASSPGSSGGPGDPAPSSGKNIRQRILGVVMDSPTPFKAILDGIPNSISRNTLVRRSIGGILSMYFRLFPHSVTRHYIQGEDALLANDGKHPYLLLYSSADDVAPSSIIDDVVTSMRERGLPVYVRKWEDSSHVDHFRPHREQYEEALTQFLDMVIE